MGYDAKWEDLTVDGKFNAVSKQLEELTKTVTTLVAISNAIDWGLVNAAYPGGGQLPGGGAGGVPPPPSWPK